MEERTSLIFKLALLVLVTFGAGKIAIPMSHADVMTTAGVLSTVSGILFGFVLAALSIFSSIDADKENALGALKRNNILGTIMSRLLSTGFTLILACIFPLVAMFLPSSYVVFGKAIDYLFILLGLSSLLISLITFTRCWFSLRKIFPHM